VGNLFDFFVCNGSIWFYDVVFFKLLVDIWVDVTNVEFLVDVCALVKGFMVVGIGFGECVVIMSKTRYEWMLIDFVVWMVGVVFVLIYEMSLVD